MFRHNTCHHLAYASKHELNICCHTQHTTYINVLYFIYILARKNECSLMMARVLSKHVGAISELSVLIKIKIACVRKQTRTQYMLPHPAHYIY
jgi:hypothetical protein